MAGGESEEEVGMEGQEELVMAGEQVEQPGLCGIPLR